MTGRPLLQLALDSRDPDEALAVARRASEHIDVVEAGTLLCLSAGMGAVRALRNAVPEKIMVGDVRIVRAGRVIAGMAFDAGADWVTVVGEAPLETVESTVRVAESRGGDVQIELHPGWSVARAREWRRLGVRQVICQNSNEVIAVGGELSESRSETILRLADLGFDVSLAGGLTVSNAGELSRLPIKIFVVGRSIATAPDPALAARQIGISVGRCG